METSTSLFWKRYKAAPIIGIIRGQSLDAVLKIAKAFEEAGLTTLEVTMNTPEAVSMISILRNKFPSLNIGAGTVCNLTDLREAIDAGAGVSKTNIKSFFQAGAYGVGMGSSLIDSKLVEAGDFEGLKNHFESLKSEIKEFIIG
mgnify:CR=1 FL=1